MQTAPEPESATSTAPSRVQCNSSGDTPGDIIVGGAVVGAVSVALYAGLKKDPVPCSLCQGTGGIRCFACGGDGRNATVSRDDLYDSKALGGGVAPPKRDPLGRTINPRDCKVCRGAGLVLCSQCKGTGFQSAF
eukprot:XP_001693223.1 DnaJ-like zinc-finger protein [Chlamydomonas reinhardtii]